MKISSFDNTPFNIVTTPTLSTASSLKAKKVADSAAIRNAIEQWKEHKANPSVSKHQVKRATQEIKRLHRLLNTILQQENKTYSSYSSGDYSSDYSSDYTSEDDSEGDELIDYGRPASILQMSEEIKSFYKPSSNSHTAYTVESLYNNCVYDRNFEVTQRINRIAPSLIFSSQSFGISKPDFWKSRNVTYTPPSKSNF